MVTGFSLQLKSYFFHKIKFQEILSGYGLFSAAQKLFFFSQKIFENFRFLAVSLR